MLIHKINGLSIEINKSYELILAFHAVYLLRHPELCEEFDFIETPNIEYMHDLEKLIFVHDYPEMIKYITNFTSSSVSIDLAICINDFYEIDYDKIAIEQINKYMKYGTIEGFTTELRKIAHDVNWDDFFSNHAFLYRYVVNSLCQFPDDLDLTDIEKYYGIKLKSYTFIPSVLINGGFGGSDKKGNLFYNRGINYDEKNKCFDVDNEYLVECLFHEFSHPIVNPMVDKYLANTETLESFYHNALKNNLFKVYSNQPEIIMYEYLVRANAYILTRKYFKDNMPPIEDDWVISHGFTYLPNLVSFIEENLSKYKNYEEFVQKKIPEFMTLCLNDEITNNRFRKT